MANALPDIAVSTPGTPVVIPVLANDNGSNLSIVSVDYPIHGSITVDPQSSITYTPDLDYSGDDSFSYSISDDAGNTSSALVTVHVEVPNYPPQAHGDVAELFVDTDVIIPILANDNDPDGDNISLIAVAMPANGTINIMPDYSLHYVPNAGFVGIDSLTYQIADGRGGQDEASVLIHVDPVNQPPVAIEDNIEISVNSSILINMMANDADPDGGSIELIGYTLPVYGTVELNSDHSIHYTPNLNYIGPDSFEYTIRDDHGAQASASVLIDIVEINNPPIAVSDNIDTDKDVPVIISPLSNDTDPDDDPIRLVAVTFPIHGNIAINPDLTITYSPHSGYTGTDSFSYTIDDFRDGTATTTVEIAVTEPSNVYVNGYSFFRQIVIGHENVHGSELQGFPLLIDLKADWLRSVANGGDVQSDDGFDLCFELENGTKLPHEIEVYDPLEGVLKAWVRVDQLNGAAATCLRLYYGKPGLSVGEADAALVWQDYQAVWHLPALSDSSPNQRDLVSVGVVSGSEEGLGEGALNFAGTGALRLDDTTWLSGLPALTIQCSSKADTVGHDHGQFNVGGFGSDADSEIVVRYDAVGFGPGGPANVIHTKIKTDTGNLGVSSAAGTQSTAMQRIALAWQSSEEAPVLSINGEPTQPSYSNLCSAPTMTSTSSPLYIGAGARDTDTGGWIGLIDEVRIRASKLSADWLRTEAANYDDPDLFFGLGDAEAISDTEASIVALPQNMQIEAGSSIDLDVVAQAYVPSGVQTPTILAITQPEHGTVSIVNNQLHYVSNGQAVEDRFTYTLNSGDKQSTASVLITATQSGEFSPALRTVEVANYAELVSAVANLQDGDHIVLADGQYDGSVISLNHAATAAAPVMIKAANLLQAKVPAGFTFGTASRHIIVHGLDLTNAKSILQGNHNRVTRCKIKPPFQASGSSLAFGARNGSQCRIDHCDISMFSGAWQSGSVYGVIRGQGSGTNLATHMVQLQIDHNWFHDLPPQIQYDQPYWYPINSAQNYTESEAETEWLVEQNLFENCNSGSIIAEFKSSKNICRYNHFLNSDGYFSIRQGHENEFYGNTMDNCKSMYVFRGPDHLVRGNRFLNGTVARVMSGKSPWDQFSTKPPHAYKAHLAGNEGSLIVGEDFGGAYHLAPQQTLIEDHNGSISYDNGATATVRSTVESGVGIPTPVTLTSADVGPNAD